MANKYKARKTEVNGILFDSRKEANRFIQLMELQKQGKISLLKMQVPYKEKTYEMDSWNRGKRDMTNMKEYVECRYHHTDCCANFSNRLAFTKEQEETFGENNCMLLTDTDFGDIDCPFFKTYPQYKKDQEDAVIRAKVFKRGYNNGFNVFYDQDWHFVCAKCSTCGTFIHDKERLLMPCSNCEEVKLRRRLEIARNEDKI